MASHQVKARPPFGRPDGVTVSDELATLGLGRLPGVAGLRTGAAALRHRGGRWRLRDWRLRTKLTAVLLVPLLLAGVLGVLRVTDLVRRAHNFAALARQVGFAQQVSVVVYDLQGERTRSAAILAVGGAAANAADRAALQAQVQVVDSAVGTLRTADLESQTFPAAGDARWVSAHQAALRRLSELAVLRQAARRPNAVPANVAARNAVAAYSGLIAMLVDLDRRTLDGTPDSLAHRADGIKALAVAEEQAAYQHAALLTGILSGVLSADQQIMLRAAETRFDVAADEFGQAVSSRQRQLLFTTRPVVDRKRLLDAALDRAARGAPLETVSGDWNSAAVATIETIRQAKLALLDELRMDTEARGDQAWHEALWDGAVIAALLVLAVALLMVVVRSLLQPLRALRTAAFEVADRRLPEVVEQFRTTDGGPPGKTAVDPVPVHSREEVGQVARAFDTVHVQAVRLAAEQAQLRSSLNDVVVNLSGRSQCMVQQQLQLIDKLRSTTQDPALMTSLVQLDRLATRTRRYSENLLVLAGGTVRRGSSDPVAVLDVLSSAVSEIDEHERVAVGGPLPAAVVAGRIVNDLIRLIAELLDNATTVAPPATMVTLGATLTENNSLLVEVTDAGPGLLPDDLQVINARLASAPAVDASVSGQLGLFVVRELAASHGITVRLRQRIGGSGLTVTVLLPPSLVTVDLRTPIDRAPGSASDGAPEGLASTGWSATEEQLPLQVSVIDEDTSADLFSPASISLASLGVVSSQASRPRTAQEEWLELFGRDEPRLESQPADEQADSDQRQADQARLAPAADLLGGPATPEQSEEVREEIYEMVSAWFRERQSVPVSDPPLTSATEWWSPFDDGWQAAQALHEPVDHEVTQAGLPRRQPRAHLVSGADDPLLPTLATARLARTPDAVRGRLSRYQRGLRVGRHARVSPGEQLSWTDISQQVFGTFGELPFEENQQ